MTAPRPPSRTLHEREPDDLEHLEELGDDAIISQQTAAHAPRPRANVSEESRSVVITDHPQKRDTEPPRNSKPARSHPRSSNEQTLVIRDRRALDEMRKHIVRRGEQQASRRRSLYMWGALGLAAFVLGGIVAFLATDGHAEPQAAAAQPSASVRAEAPAAAPAPPPTIAPTPSPAPTDAPRAVRLDDLPVESPKKH